MSKIIKTRDVVRDVKTLNRRTAILTTVRQVSTKTKELSSSGEDHADGTSVSYAQDKVSRAGKSIVNEARRGANKVAKKTIDASRNISRKAAQRTATHRFWGHSFAEGVSPKTSVNRAAKTVKTAATTASKAVKTPNQVVRATKASAKAAQVTARGTTQAARVAARTAVSAAKAVVKGAATFTRVAMATLKSLVSAIAAGSSAAVAVILVVCMVGMLASSAFGIFFSGSNPTDGNPSLREVVAEIDSEHRSRIEEAKSSYSYDEVVLVGSKAHWQEVLAVFAVRTTTDVNNPLDVITMDTQRQALLRQTFWDINSIDCHVTEREVTELVLKHDDEGNPFEASETITVRTLYITLSHLTACEAASAYSFTSKQQDTLNELLSSSYDTMWQSVLYGTNGNSGDIVEVAVSQVGNYGGMPYWSWYGFSNRVEWCAVFVSWCANECGYIESGTAPRFSWCPAGIQWFQETGRWHDANSGYIPKPGDIIFFDWQRDGTCDHVGIVESCDGVTVRTVEGNASNAVGRRGYPVTSTQILGYGILR